MDRDPAEIASVPARDSPIDVGDFDRSQANAPFVEPIEEAVDRSTAAMHRVFRPPALFMHPRRKGRDLVSVGVARPFGFLQHVHEAKPPYGVTEESPTLLGLRSSAASAPAGQRPLSRRGFHPRHADTLALVQVQKVNEVDLMRRDHAQRLPPSTSFSAVRQVAKPFIQQRRIAISSDDAGTGEKILEHGRVSLWLETRPSQSRANQKVMLRRTGRLPCSAGRRQPSAT